MALIPGAREKIAGLFFDKGGAAINPKHPDFGCKGDARHVVDAAITTGTPTLTSVTAAFALTDAGKTIMVTRAGAANANLTTTILAYVNATTVTLAANASSTVSGRFAVWGTNDTPGVLAALAASAGRIAPVQFPDGGYIIDSEMVLSSYQTVYGHAGVNWYQITPGINGFKADLKIQSWVHYNGAILYGPGIWSNAWADDSHEERGHQLRGCIDSGGTNTKIKNFGFAGICVRGGTNVKFNHPDVEGTHNLGSPLALSASFQFAYLIYHDATYGQCKQVTFESPIGSYTNFGVNTLDTASAGLSTGSIAFNNAIFTDIIGQHAAYISTSHTALPNLKAFRCGLIGVKFFSGVINEQITHTTAHNFLVEDCGGDASHMGVSGTGFIDRCHMSGTAKNVSRLHVSDGDVRRSTARVTGHDITNRGLYVAKSLSANAPTDCTWDIEAYNCTEKGVLVSAAGSDRNTLLFKGRRFSVGGGGHWAVGLNNCSGITILRLDVSDDLGGMTFGLYAEVNALGIKIQGTPNVQGYTTNAFRSDVVTSPVRWECMGMDVTSETTAFFGQANNFLPITPLTLGRQTTVNANVPIWQMTADDESVYTVNVELIGKLLGSAERRGAHWQATFWRDAAGVLTQQGATSALHDVQSASFVGTASFIPTVNDIRIVVNSAAAATYDWRVKVSVLKLP